MIKIFRADRIFFFLSLSKNLCSLPGLPPAGASSCNVIGTRKSDREWKAGYGRNNGCLGPGTEGGDDQSGFLVGSEGWRTEQLPAWKLSEGYG